MKTKLISLRTGLSTAALAFILATGCNRPSESAKAPQVASAEKTSFNEVTSHLDPGGDLYGYLGTEQILGGLSDKVSHWRQFAASMPNVSQSDQAQIEKAFDVVASAIKDSGIEEISGFGLSAIATETNFYHIKTFLHHYPDRNTGLLWKVFGRQPHALAGLDLLPANTALAFFSDLDVPLIWSELKARAAQIGMPKAQEFMDRMPAEFQRATGMKWETVLDSLGGEFGLVITLDSARMIPVPLPTSEALEVPEPGLMIIVKIKDDAIFNRVDEALKQTKQQTITVDKAGVRMRTVPVPLPLPVALRPTLATANGYLILASTDALVNEALAVRSGGKPGLKATDEFKRLSRGIGDQGNQFTFVSERFTRTAIQIQRQVMAMNHDMQPQVKQWIESLQRTNAATFSYCVSANTPEGWLSVGNGNQQPAKMLLAAAVAMPVGMLAAIAIPNFVRAREISQKNACINNLRQIDAAKQQWALEKGLPATSMPSKQDLLPYLGKRFPACPAGGSYALGAVDESPTCSVRGHTLSATR